MSKRRMPGKELIPKLRELLPEIPDSVKSVRIEANVDGCVSVDCAFHPLRDAPETSFEGRAVETDG